MASDFNKRHFIVETSAVASARATGHIYSVKSATNMDNGMLAKLGNIVTGEREIFEVTAPKLGDKVVLINNPALIYEQYTTLQGAEYNYFNEAGSIVRAYDLIENDRFSVSVEAFTAITPDTGLVVENTTNYIVNDGTGKYKEVATLEGTEGFVGQVMFTKTFGLNDTRVYIRVIQNAQK